jgi:hypothetical protein
MDQVEAEGWDLARKCLTFELQFESTAAMSTGDGSYTSKVEATIKVEMVAPGEMQTDAVGRIINLIQGSGPLDNTDFEFKPKRCSATGITGGGTFQAVSLDWQAAPPDGNYPYGHVKAIHLTYDPGNTSESVRVSCSGRPTVTQPPQPLWTMAFEALHMSELSGTSAAGAGPSIPDLGSLLGGSGIPSLPGLPGASNLPALGGETQPGSGGSNPGSGMNFTTTGWAVRGGELFAQKEWQTSVAMTTTGTEEGSFKLYHKPQ